MRERTRVATTVHTLLIGKTIFCHSSIAPTLTLLLLLHLLHRHTRRPPNPTTTSHSVARPPPPPTLAVPAELRRPPSSIVATFLLQSRPPIAYIWRSICCHRRVPVAPYNLKGDLARTCMAGTDVSVDLLVAHPGADASAVN